MSPVNTTLRIALLIWVVGYLVVSCVPLLTGHLFIGGITFIAGLIFLIPWVIGILVLVLLIWLTEPRPR